jgi:hypothetical protein
MSDAAAPKGSRRLPVVGLLLGVILFALAAKMLLSIARHSSLPFRERHGLDAILAGALFTAIIVLTAAAAAAVGKKLNVLVCMLGATAAGAMAAMLYKPVFGAVLGLVVGVVVAFGFAKPVAVVAFGAAAAMAAGSLVGFAGFAVTDAPVDPVVIACMITITMLCVVVGEAIVLFVACRAGINASLRRKLGASMLLPIPFLLGIWIGLSIDTLWRVRLIEGTADLSMTPVSVHWLWGGCFDVNVVAMSTHAREEDILRLRRFRNLTFFSDHNGRLTDAGLRHVGELSKLRSFVTDRSAVTDAGLRHLRELKGLQMVRLRDTAVSGEGLSHLCSTIARLALSGSSITDDSVRHLQHMTSLASLSLEKSQITDAGLDHLRPLATLEWLWLRGTRVSDAGLATLNKFPSLTRLDLTETHVTDAGLEHLKLLPSLTHLSLANTHLTDDGIRQIMAISTLTDLNLEGTKVTKGAIEELRKALPNLRIDPPDYRTRK